MNPNSAHLDLNTLRTVGRSESAHDDPRLCAAIEDYLQACEAGQSPKVEAFVRRYPEIAEELCRCLAGLELVRHAGPDITDSTNVAEFELAASSFTEPLGDYRILREVGRGGMGIVYEAEQLSLARRVALKVLPFAAVLDSRHLQRFKNESMAAAHLDHPHIVEVYGVGCDRGIHYYAMRFVEGLTLAEVIDARKGSQQPESVGRERRMEVGIRKSELTSKDLDVKSALPLPNSESRIPSLTDTSPVLQAALSTFNSTSPKERFCRLAELGVQAAEALDHAHQMGIVHRDIKPSNLMLDERGKLWITDFGLAHNAGDASMTMTGDLVGTLRYMSPEQAESGAAILDHRTDIYSLGATLYELATDRPVVQAQERAAILREIAEKDPEPPRKFVPAMPADLETILLKCLAKEPSARYDSSQALADDLQRFLAQKPVVAKRPSYLERVQMWTRRHQAITAVSMIAVAMIAITSASAALFSLRSYRAEAHQRVRAEANLLLAADSIDRMLTRVASDSTDHGDLERAATLSQDAMNFYDRLLQSGDNPALRFRTAKSLGRVAQIWIPLKKPEQARLAREQAQRILESLILSDPERAEYRIALADNYIEMGWVETARVLLATKKDPPDPAYASVGDHIQRAHEVMREVVKLRPEEADYEVLLDQTKYFVLQAAYFAGEENSLARLAEESEELFDKLDRRIVNPGIAFTSQDIITTAIAQTLAEGGEDNEAMQVLDEAVIDPTPSIAAAPTPAEPKYRYELLRRLILTHLAARRHAEAAENVERLVLGYRDRLIAYVDSVELLIRCAEVAETPASEIMPVVSPQSSVGAAYRRRARQLVAEAGNAPTRPPEAMQKFAFLLLTCHDRSLRDFQQALDLARKAYALRPGRREGMFTLALAHYRNGQFAEADSMLSKSLAASADGQGALLDQFLLALILHERNLAEDRDSATFVHASAHAAIDKLRDELRLLDELDEETADHIQTQATSATEAQPER